MRFKHLILIFATIPILVAPLAHAVDLSTKQSGKIARVVGFLLSQTHFKRAPLDDEISKLFLRKYMESLDYSRMVFLQSDYKEFEAKYGTLLDNLTKRGDVTRHTKFISAISLVSKQRMAGLRKSFGQISISRLRSLLHLIDRSRIGPPQKQRHVTFGASG